MKNRWLFCLPPLLAFGFFLIYVSQTRSQPFFKYLVANPLVYDLEAKQLLRGIPAGQPFFLSALYPAFVGLFYWLSGWSKLMVAVCQGVFLSLNVLLLGRISRRLFSNWTALAAGFGMTFYWSFYYFAGEIVPATIFMTFMLVGTLLFMERDGPETSHVFVPALGLAGVLALMYATPGLRNLAGLLQGKSLPYAANLYWAGIAFFTVLAAGEAAIFLGARSWLRRHRMQNLAASGTMFAVSALMWSGATVMAGLLVLNLLFEKGRRFIGAMALIAGFLVPILASLAHNYLISGDAIPVTSSFGVNLFVGNNRASDGMDPFRFGEANRVRIEADRLRLSGKQRSDFFADQAIRFATSEPGRWLRLLGRKALISVSRTQINNNADIAERRSAWKRLFLPALNFGIIFPLAAAGIVSVLGANRRALILVLGFASFFAVGIGFFVCERFRLPGVVFLIPLAAYGVEMLLRYTASRDLPKLALSCGVVLAAGVLSNVDFLGISRYEMPAITANKAYVERLAGNRPEARRLAQHALSLDPSAAGTYFQIGAIEDEEGNRLQAFTAYLDCLERDPFFVASYEAARRILEAQRISTSYLDAYVQDLLDGKASTNTKTNLIDFLRHRLP